MGKGLDFKGRCYLFRYRNNRHSGAEIVQVGLLSPAGEVLLDSLVRPQLAIPAAATAIHGITDAMCADAPSLDSVLLDMRPLMHGKEVVVYNKGFDQGTLHGALRRRHGDLFADEWIAACRWTCAMEQYSAFVGDFSQLPRGNYRWQKLPGAGHSAIEDCRGGPCRYSERWRGSSELSEFLDKLCKPGGEKVTGGEGDRVIAAVHATDKEPKAKKLPRVFPCGCSESGGRCPEEGRLYGWLEASLRWGNALEQAEARTLYYDHFDAGRRELSKIERAEWAKKTGKAGKGRWNELGQD